MACRATRPQSCCRNVARSARYIPLVLSQGDASKWHSDNPTAKRRQTADRTATFGDTGRHGATKFGPAKGAIGGASLCWRWLMLRRDTPEDQPDRRLMTVTEQTAAGVIHARILMGSRPRVERALKPRHNATPGDKMKKTPIHSTWSQFLTATVDDNSSHSIAGDIRGLAVPRMPRRGKTKRLRAAAFGEAFEYALDDEPADPLATASIAVSRRGSVLQHSDENP